MGSVVPFSVVSGHEAWAAADYPSPSTYTYTFSLEDIAELNSAVASVVQRGLDIKVSLPASHVATPVSPAVCRQWLQIHRCVK